MHWPGAEDKASIAEELLLCLLEAKIDKVLDPKFTHSLFAGVNCKG